MTKTLHDKLTEKFKDDPEYKRMYKELEDEESKLEKKLSVNSEKSPPHFSKTIDKHFWDLV